MNSSSNNKCFDYKKAVAFLKAKEKAGKKQNFELYLQAKKDFDSIVDMLREYNPKRIYQWGSLLNSEQFDVNSDIDIAVEGIKSVAIFF